MIVIRLFVKVLFVLFVLGSVFVTVKLLTDYWMDSLFRSSLRGVPRFVWSVVFG